MILIARAKAFKRLVMPDKYGTHLRRNSSLPGIIFPHATRSAPLSAGNQISVHPMNSLPRVPASAMSTRATSA
jgi:hypothetical protein